MKPQIRAKFRLAAVTAAVLVAVACGGGDDSPTSDPTATAVDSTSGNQQVAARGDAESGRKLFTREGCSACHRINSDRLVGPGLAGIDKRGDDAYIRKSITQPGADVVEGFNNVMAEFSNLSDEQVDDLVAYLKTLE